jgi:Dyp-type peroxidase family
MHEEPVLALEEIQGIVTPGFNKDHQHLLFLRIADAAAARDWLADFGRELSSAAETLSARILWKAMRARLGEEPGARLPLVQWACAFSAAGLRRLTSDDEIAEFADEAFTLGMEARSTLLGDPPTGPGCAGRWLVGGPGTKVDVLLIGASDDLELLQRQVEAVALSASAASLELVHLDRGVVSGRNQAGHEHFGFKDGVSQPAMRGRRTQAADDYYEARLWPFEPDLLERRDAYAAPGRPLVWPGHFLFGYEGQMRDEPQTPNPSYMPRGPGWAANGSFLVFRRLRQDVDAFESFLEATATRLQQQAGTAAPGVDRLGALLVGRWKSGSPVSYKPHVDQPIPASCENEFSFSTARTFVSETGAQLECPADPQGIHCPLGAHIRKVNPRDDDTDIGPAARTLQKLMLRRGITYDDGPADGGVDDRGLLFLAFQSSIQDQFEFLTTDWINLADRPVDEGGHDPILAQGSGRYVNLKLGGNTYEIPLPGNFVVPTGGEYFFTPSLAFFRERLTSSPDA